MSRPIVTCPGCLRHLQSDRPLPAGRTFHCPCCRMPFQASLIELAPPAPLFGAPFVIAVSFVLLLGGSLIVATVILVASRPVPTLAQPAEEPPPVEVASARPEPPPLVLVLDPPAVPDPVRVPPPPPLAENVIEPQPDPAEIDQQRRADFRKHMDAGKTAFLADRFADAIREYAAAQKLQPEDLEAQQGQKQAAAKLAALADRQKRQAAFDDLFQRGKKALEAKRFQDAIAALEPALRLMPDDRDALRLLRTAKEKLKSAKATNPKLLAQADDAARRGRLDEAQRLVDEAARAWPEDEQAQRLQKTVTRLVASAPTAQAAYLNHVQQGTLAMAGARYAEAVQAFTEAVRLAPLDLDVQRNLRMARAALERDLRLRGAYERLYQAGSLALARGAHAEAMRYFGEALKLVPGDLPAAEGLSKAKYARALLEGQLALRLRKKTEAVTAFEAALAERPGDLSAGLGLRQAQLLR